MKYLLITIAALYIGDTKISFSSNSEHQAIYALSDTVDIDSLYIPAIKEGVEWDLRVHEDPVLTEKEFDSVQASKIAYVSKTDSITQQVDSFTVSKVVKITPDVSQIDIAYKSGKVFKMYAICKSQDIKVGDKIAITWGTTEVSTFTLRRKKYELKPTYQY
jgi:hypothetical protein